MLSLVRQGFGRHIFSCFRQRSRSLIRSMSTTEPAVKGATDSEGPESAAAKDQQMDAPEAVQADRVKRPIDQEGSEEPAAKIQKSENSAEVQPDETVKKKRYPKKKVAMMLSYSGVGYQGMQINPGTKTIEKELLNALCKSGSVTEGSSLGKLNFQRCARTDKGVSAAGQVVSLKMLLLDDLVEKLNEHLPPVIRVMDVKRTTQGFNSKQQCNYRTYMYLLPTYSFQDVEGITTEKYRITDEKLKEVNDLLSQYKGTHNFHNFTSGKLFEDMSANRYIMDFVCEKAFDDEGIEFALMRVKGQSFMLHQIRKMIGLIIAVIRGFAPKTIIERAFGGEKLDIPRAPGLGLVLESVHYDWYNKKWSGDGVHDELTWESCREKQEAFKRKHIYPNIIIREKYNRSMMHWMSTLPLHSYDVVGKHNPMRSFLAEQKDQDGKKILTNTDQFPNDVDLSEFKSGQTPEEFLQTLPTEPEGKENGTDSTSENTAPELKPTESASKEGIDPKAEEATDVAPDKTVCTAEVGQGVKMDNAGMGTESTNVTMSEIPPEGEEETDDGPEGTERVVRNSEGVTT